MNRDGNLVKIQCGRSLLFLRPESEQLFQNTHRNCIVVRENILPSAWESTRRRSSLPLIKQVWTMVTPSRYQGVMLIALPDAWNPRVASWMKICNCNYDISLSVTLWLHSTQNEPFRKQQHRAYVWIRRRPVGTLDQSCRDGEFFHDHDLWHFQWLRDCPGTTANFRSDLSRPATAFLRRVIGNDCRKMTSSRRTLRQSKYDLITQWSGPTAIKKSATS